MHEPSSSRTDAWSMRPRTVGEILDAGIKLYLDNVRTILQTAAVVVIPLQILSGVVLLSITPRGDTTSFSGVYGISTHAHRQSDAGAAFAGSLLIGLGGLVISAFVLAASVKAVSDAYLAQRPSTAVSLGFALRRLGPVVGCELLFILGLTVAFVCLLIPGIWLYAAWSLAVPALLIERLGPISALGRSRRLVSGRWWPTAAVLFVAEFMSVVIGSAMRALLTGGRRRDRGVCHHAPVPNLVRGAGWRAHTREAIDASARPAQ